jgi:DNA-binding transcriptional LysR family regulator
MAAMEAAIRAGLGIGFLSAFKASEDPDLVEIMPPRPEWDAPLWIVTHVDLHRTRKVQAFLTVLKDAAKSWSV